jgi:predicted Holliday junction resolvase-like endonuclease
MIILIIGIVTLILLVYIVKNYYLTKDMRDKASILMKLDIKESLMKAEEKIVSKEILLKKRKVKLDKEKEKLNEN